MVLGDEDVGERGSGLGIGGVAGKSEVAAVGGFGSGEIGGCFGDLGGEEDVVGLLGGELECGEEGVRRGGWIWREVIGGVAVQIELGEGAESSALECGLVGGEIDCGKKFGAGFGEAIGTGEQEAESYVRGWESGIRRNGLAVAGFRSELGVLC